MVRFLILYHLEKMATWFFLVPIGAGLLASPFLLFSDDYTVFLYPLLIATVLVLSIFLEQTIPYQSMLRTMPLPVRTLVQAKFLFSALIIIYQLTLFALLVSKYSFDTVLPLVTTAFTICTIATNLILLYHFYTGQQKQTTTVAIIFYMAVLVISQKNDVILFTNMTLNNGGLLLLSLTILTFVNAQLCLYFVKIKSHY